MSRRKYTEKENQTILKRLVEEVRVHDATVTPIQIRGILFNALISKYICSTDASRRFFLSKSEDVSLKEKGLYDIKVQRQRRRNRVMKVCFCLAYMQGYMYLFTLEIGVTKGSSREDNVLV